LLFGLLARDPCPALFTDRFLVNFQSWSDPSSSITGAAAALAGIILDPVYEPRKPPGPVFPALTGANHVAWGCYRQ